MQINNEEVDAKLRSIPVPGGKSDIVTAGIVQEATATSDQVFVRLGTGEMPEKQRRLIEVQVHNGLKAIGFQKVTVKADGAAKSARQLPVSPPPRAQPAPQAQPARLLPDVKSIIAVASGKGGVGKSTVATNLACALAARGLTVGILDTDVYGPNIPMMFGLEGARPEVQDNRVLPLEQFGVRVMSLGFLAPRDEAIIWRGPLVGRAIEQMLRDVAWGDLDVLVLDLPPGTGDAQLTLSQRLELSGAVLVSTPQPVALSDAVKGLKMFQKVNVPILGMIENMSAFICDSCDKEHDIFGKGGVRKAAAEHKVPFLGEIPITPALRTGGDSGKPVVVAAPDSPVGQAFFSIADKLAAAAGDADAEAPKHFQL